MVTYDELLEEMVSVVRANDYVTSLSDLDVRLTQMEADELAEDVDDGIDSTDDDEIAQTIGLSITIADRNELVKPDGEVVSI